MEEEQQEQIFIEHHIHEHPLKRISNMVEVLMSREQSCYGCGRYFLAGDAGYGCSIVDCHFRYCLHEECAKMGREIRHPVHPSHPLVQKIVWDISFFRKRCAVCALSPFVRKVWLVYICSQGCKFHIDLGCVGGLATADDHKVISHPSHPQHELKFIKRSCPFKCDACGTTKKGNSYICTICQYWIHGECATLPSPAPFHHHPHHSLSIAFTLPVEYVTYNYTCGICRGSLRLTNWVYHCQLCRYVVHINCATNKSLAATSNSIENENADDGRGDILKGPINDIYEQLIKPFVKREIGKILIPHDDKEINTAYKFHNHHHPLRFTSFSSLQSSNEDYDYDYDDDDDDERLELTCDGCASPIRQSLSTSSCSSSSLSSSSSSSYESGYMSCCECKYFLHLACFNLPQYLPSHPLHRINDHHLNLQSPKEVSYDWTMCSICYLYTNGLFYACTKCSFKIDIKCISLPDTIKHAGHPHNDLKLVICESGMRFCLICSISAFRDMLFYRCDNCTFLVCCGCAMLPASNIHISDKHVLPLTFDASFNHPGDFYCACCEVKMNPKSWMYHCKDCDQSFHPHCIPATSGRQRNINFGRQQYQVRYHPQHPLRFQLISKKKSCSLCHIVVYDYPGYQCTSCNFVMCLLRRHEDDVKPID